MLPANDSAASRFVVGANLPWVGYGTDFGASGWFPEGGLSAQPAALGRLDHTLAALERDGIAVLRLFMLCDGRSGIRFDSHHLPIGLDDSVFPDIDALLTAAKRHHVRVMPVLRRLRRFWRTADRLDALQQFLSEAVQCVRASARQPVTVGCAGTWHLHLVKPLGLDFYQVHWYERFGWSALERPVAELGLDRPVILGEFSGVRSRWGIADVLDTARQAGYQGAFVWSLLSEDAHSGYPPEVVKWARAQSERH